MAKKHTQTTTELKQHLEEQKQFILNSVSLFDNGCEIESKRIATSIRILLHNTDKSHSLLGQLDMLNVDFLSTTSPNNQLFTYNGLVIGCMMGNGMKYVAPLDKANHQKWVSFSNWWNEIIFIDKNQKSITREYLVLKVANQDGGAHVGPTVDRKYADLTRHNSLDDMYSVGLGDLTMSKDWEPEIIPIQNIELVAMRQIAHEILKTLINDYHKDPIIMESGLSIGIVATEK